MPSDTARDGRQLSTEFTTLIQLDDGILVEAWAPEGHSERISGGLARAVTGSMESVVPTLVAAAKTVLSACHALEKERAVQDVELELGLAFEAEGNIYVTRSMAQANIVLRMKFRP